MKKCSTIFLLALLLVQVAIAQTVTYTESTAEIQNPDRGFYTPINGIASSFTPLTSAQLISLRTNPFTPWNGNYTVSPTIIFRHYVLDIFKSSNLSTAFLNGVQADFNAARAAGVRLMIRFSYTITPPTGSCGSWICPPYGDAPKSIVLQHIAQLKPYLQSNSDVILAVQNGFIGVWGEQYYTDYFGDASVQGKLTNQNWQDRIDVLAALLDAVPSNRMVQVRYPQMKQKFIYGISAPVTSAAMTSSQAHNGSNIARLGFHNDCFLSASDDQGTYWDYGTSTTSASNQTTILKAYAANDSQYNAVGGETCSDAFSPQNDCAGQTISDMDLLNYSYLNSDYENLVNNDWQTGGCMDQIKRRFGYRFVMRNGTFPSSVTSGGNLTFTLNIANVGFAAPFNQRILKLVLRNTSTSAEYKIDITGANSDTRFWLSGQTVNLNKTVTLPSNIPTGTYALLLHVSDPSNSNAVANRPEYSIQFANTGTWEPTTGYNKLNANVTVTSSSSAPAAPTNLTASAASSSQINLSWNASSGATSYSVHRSTTSGGTYTQVASGLTSTSYSNTGLSASTTYYYVVRATNANGTSGNSNQASATTTSGGGGGSIVIDGNAGDWSSISSITTNGTGGIASMKATHNATDLYILAQGTSISTNYQLFIDTDNDNTGSNEYTASGWPSTGFNYMVENGTLLQYIGSGTDWLWNPIGAVSAVKNSTVLEVRIARSSLGTLATTIRLAVASINSSWTTVGYVPASGGSGASYTIGGSSSPTTIVVDGNAGEWSAIPTISTNGTGGIGSLKAADNATYLYVLAQGTGISTNYQLFIDTDNNNTGSNEYNASGWSSQGFNYMVENGSLFVYNGTGTNWLWNLLGSVSAVKNSTVLEVRVPRSSLGTLSSTIRIAAASINSSWTTVGNVPASGGAGAAYTVGSSAAARMATVQEPPVEAEVDNELSLHVYPNPSEGILQLKYSVTKEGPVSFNLYNTLGQEVRAVDFGNKSVGVHEEIIDVSAFRGYHVIKLKTQGGVHTQRVRIK